MSGCMHAGISLDEIRRPTLDSPPPIEERIIWAVPHALALRHSVDEVVEACELLALTATTSLHARPQGAIEGSQLRHQILWELDALGFSGAGATFESPGEPQTAAFDLQAFAYHAQVCLPFLSR
jgi:hypothetical protein